MTERSPIENAVHALAPELPRELVASHLAGLDDAYIEEHSAETIASHARLSALLDGARPVALHLEAHAAGRFELTVVGFDYFGEFAILCGILAAHGLDIHSGHVFTCRPPQASGSRPARGRHASGSPAWLSPRIVDTFVVSPAPGGVLDDSAQGSLLREMEDALRRVGAGALPEARNLVNRRLAERLDRRPGQRPRVLYPIDVAFEDQPETRWTVMDVRSQDTPAFLYALANALSMRGVYIHRVEIESHGDQVHDRFYIGDRHGGRIDDPERRSQLRTTVGLIKQFTHFLPAAPDPAIAIRHFDQLVDKVLESAGEDGAQAVVLEHLDELAHLLGSSRFLWEDFLRMQWENLGPLLSDRSTGFPRGRESFARDLARALESASTFEEKRRALNAFKDRAMFMIDLRQIQEPGADLAEFSAALTELAEAVLAGARDACAADLKARHGWPRHPSGEEVGFAIFALGKFGGGELGYASDIELLFAYEPGEAAQGPEGALDCGLYFDTLVRSVTGFVETRQHGIFEIDLRLRPYGRKGPLASSVEQLARYYAPGGEAASFERQALTKLRWVCGSDRVRRTVEDVQEVFVYGAEPWDRDTALHLRWRQCQELARPGAVNLKYSPGGLIDVEYAAQYLQVQHGHEWPEVRTPNTLVALERLAARGALSAAELEGLRDAYVLLRRAIDGLRMVRGNAKDLELPPAESEELMFLARRLGRGAADWRDAARGLAAEIRAHMEAARTYYVRAFGEPGPRERAQP